VNAEVANAFIALEDALPSPRDVVPRGTSVSTMLAEPSRAIAPIAPSDPARLGYPATFPFELALRTSSTQAICEAYAISREEWDLIRIDPSFLADLERAVKVVAEEGMSFKIKAKLQAEELLKTSWRLIHDQRTPPNVQADLLKATMRWAEYDQPPQKDGGGPSRGFFSINFHFSKELTVHPR
jgi:hypothetical protein